MADNEPKLDFKFGGLRHGFPKPETVVEPSFDNLPLMQQLLRVGITHGCPNPIRVALEIGLSMADAEQIPLSDAIENAEKWLITRQKECNGEFAGIVDLSTELNPNLHAQLLAPVDRLPGEQVGEYNHRLVSSDYAEKMPPGSTPWGYGLARVKIEQMGRGDDRTAERIEKSNELTKKAILESSTPIELLVSLASLVVPQEYGGEGNADPRGVLSQTLSATSLNEQGCRHIFKEIMQGLQKRSPKLYEFYLSLSHAELKDADIVDPSEL